MDNISVIKPKHPWLSLNLNELWHYRDLLLLFVKRDIKVVYQQTILGPLWFFIQPLLTTIMFLLVFGKIAGISTDGVPPVLFYMSGLTFWNFFSESLKTTSDTFVKNASIFGKVYFPRLITPVSVVMSNVVKFLIQFALFLAILIYYLFTNTTVHPNIYILFTPVLLLQCSLLSLGFGLIISAVTTKYRDFNFLIQFGIQLWMYATPIIFPLSKISLKYRWIIEMNPMTYPIELFKYSYTGTGVLSFNGMMVSSLVTLFVLFLGIVIFNKTEKNFMDTV